MKSLYFEENNEKHKQLKVEQNSTNTVVSTVYINVDIFPKEEKTSC